MAKAVNQNNIAEIINSDINHMKDVVDTISSIGVAKTLKATAVIKQSRKFFKHANRLKKPLETLVDTINDMPDLTDAFDTIHRYVDIVLENNLDDVIEAIKIVGKHEQLLKEIAGMRKSTLKLVKTMADIEKINDTLDKVSVSARLLRTIVRDLNSIEIDKGFIVRQIMLRRTMSILNDTFRAIRKISTTYIPAETVAQVKILTEIAHDLSDVVGIMNAVDPDKSASQMRALSRYIRRFMRVIQSLNSIDLTIISRRKARIMMETAEYLKVMFNIIEQIEPELSLRKLWTIRRAVRRMKRIVKSLNDVPSVLKATINAAQLVTIAISLKYIFKAINETDMSILVYLKLRRMKRSFRYIRNIMAQLIRFRANTMVRAEFNVGRLLLIFTSLKYVFNTISDIKLGMMFNYKMKRILYGIKKIRKIVAQLLRMGRHVGGKELLTATRIATELMMVSYMLKLIFRNLSAIKVSVLLPIRMMILEMVLGRMQNLIDTINDLDIDKKSIKKILLVKILAWSLASICTSLIKFSKTAIIVLLLSPVIILEILALGVILRLIADVVEFISKGIKLDRAKLKGFVYMTLIITIITAIAVELVVLSLLAAIVLNRFVKILLFIGALYAIMVAMSAMLFAVAVFSPLIEFAAIGMAFFAAVTTMFVVIAAELAIIGSIKLDRDAIKNNIAIINESVFMIIDMVFQSMTAPRPGDSVFTTLLRKVLGPVEYMVEAILASTFLVLTFVSITMVLLMAAELMLIAKIKLDPVKIRSTVTAVMNAATLVIDSIFDRKDDKNNPSKKGFIARTLGKLGQGVMDILEAVMAVAFVALSLLSISMVLLMATELMLIAKIKLDPAKIRSTVTAVMNAATLVIDSIFDRKDDKNNPSKKGFIRRVIETMASGLIDMLEAIMAVAFVALSLLSVSMVLLLAKQLKKLENIDFDSEKIRTNITMVMDSIHLVMDSIFNHEEPQSKEGQSWLSKLLRWVLPDRLLDIIDALVSVGYLALVVVAIGSVHKIATQLADLAALPDLTNAKSKATTVMNTAEEVIKQVTKDVPDTSQDVIRKLERTADAVDLIVKISEKLNKLNETTGEDFTGKVFDNYSSFIKTVDSADLTKLKQTTSMLEQMAKFSKSINGNFEGLSRTLNENIMPLLGELKDLMENMPDSIEKASASISSSISANSGEEMMTDRTLVRAQIRRENPSADAAEINRLADERVAANSAANTRAITSKLEELIDLLKYGTGGGIPVRQI